MNILYINTHDTGRYIQPYGHAVPTPNLMRLAEEGLLFRQAFCTAPTCSPSRAGLLTGKMPHTNGMWGLSHRGFSLTRPEDHLASYLGRNGFDTVLCGVQHESEAPSELGYRTILDPQDYSMGKCDRDWYDFDVGNARRVAAYLRDRDTSTPFFLSYGIFNTHRKFPDLTGADRADYVMPPSPLWDTPENRRDMAAYIRSAAIMDECVGIVLDALWESKCGEDTLVIFTTDHGIAFPEMKGTLYDTGIGVSLILRAPGGARGAVSDALVSHLDIFPTLCELCGLPAPQGLQGASLAPLLECGEETVRGEIFAESSFHVAYEPQRCVRTQRFKYIRRYSAHRTGMPSNVDDSPDKQRRIAEGYYRRERDSELLFDLHSDPVERVNLANDPAFQDTKAQLSALLDRWLEQSDDPVRHGPMIPPDGALVNYPDSLSPAEKVYIEDYSELAHMQFGAGREGDGSCS